MKPLSRRIRFIYLALSVFAFIVTVPVAVLYASGYHFNGISFVERGGIYISVPTSGASVSINGKEEGISSLFNRSFYDDSLTAGSYVVEAAREGYYPFIKKLTVEPRIVTDVSVFLVPQTLTIREIEVKEGDVVASTTRAVSKSEYAQILKAFKVSPVATSQNTAGATSTPFDAHSSMELYVEKGNVVVRSTKDAQSLPSSFCAKPSLCVQEFFIEKGEGTATNAKFFVGGVVYSTKESGVFLAENDIRLPRLVVPIYTRPGAAFRILNGALIIKDGTSLYEVSGF